MTFTDDPDEEKGRKLYGIITILLFLLFPINLVFAPLFIMDWLEERKWRKQLEL